jgi:hypothetical protein
MRDDMRIFHDYACRTMDGLIPYRQFTVEYPIAALPFFLLPRIAGPALPTYWVAFAAEILLFNACAVFLSAWWVNRTLGPAEVRGCVAWYTAFFVSLCPLIITKYDAIPMALGFGAACAWFTGRAKIGGCLAGIGALTKIFPGAIAAPGLIWDATRPPGQRGRGLAALVASVAAATASWLALGGVGVLDSLRYHAERGIELGSLYAGLLMAIGTVTRAPMNTAYTHFSTELVAPGTAVAAAVAFPIQVGAIGIVMVRCALVHCAEPMRDAGAAILAFIVFGKVLSPQYLIWLLPFLAVISLPMGTWVRLGFLGACCATTLVYPWGMDRLPAFHPLAIAALNGRNALLLLLWLFLIFGPLSRAKTDPATVRSGTGEPWARETGFSEKTGFSRLGRSA